MHSKKVHPYSVAALFFPVKSWLITLLNQSWAVSYPSCSQALVNVSVCCCGLRYFVVVVRLFIFVFYCETTARDCVATVWKNWLLQTLYCDLSVQSVRGYKNQVVRVLFWWHNSRHAHCTSRTRKQWSILWALWYSCEWAFTDTEEKKLLNKVVIFVFFAHKIILVAS